MFDSVIDSLIKLLDACESLNRDNRWPESRGSSQQHHRPRRARPPARLGYEVESIAIPSRAEIAHSLKSSRRADALITTLRDQIDEEVFAAGAGRLAWSRRTRWRYKSTRGGQSYRVPLRIRQRANGSDRRVRALHARRAVAQAMAVRKTCRREPVEVVASLSPFSRRRGHRRSLRNRRGAHRQSIRKKMYRA